MAMGIRILPEELRTFDSSTFTGSYQAFGAALDNPTVILKIVNDSTVDVTISWDGATDNDIITAGSFFLYDITANRKTDDGFYIGKGTQFWVKGSAGTGNLYLVSFYAAEV